MPVNTPYLSDNTTFFSNVSISGNLAAASFVQFSSASLSRVTTQYAALQSSIGTVDFAQGNVLSWRTLAASSLTVSAANTNVRDREIVFTCGGASGVSLAIYSNGTVYIFSSSLSAKAT